MACKWTNYVRTISPECVVEEPSGCGASNPAYEIIFWKRHIYTYEQSECTDLRADLLSGQYGVWAILLDNGVPVSPADDSKYVLRKTQLTTDPGGGPEYGIGLAYWPSGTLYVNDVSVDAYHALTLDQDMTGYIVSFCLGTDEYPGQRAMELDFYTKTYQVVGVKWNVGGDGYCIPTIKMNENGTPDIENWPSQYAGNPANCGTPNCDSSGYVLCSILDKTTGRLVPASEITVDWIIEPSNNYPDGPYDPNFTNWDPPTRTAVTEDDPSYLVFMPFCDYGPDESQSYHYHFLVGATVNGVLLPYEDRQWIEHRRPD